MSREPVCIESATISGAWLEAMRALLVPGVSRIAPLVISVNVSKHQPLEDVDVRSILDQTLLEHGICTCHTTANTIFPLSLWNQNMGRTVLFRRYRTILPRIKSLEKQNRYGLYFERLMMFMPQGGRGSVEFNQLEHIIRTFRQGNRRRSALQASVFDPTRDHTHQRRRGFPCLQHVFFAPNGNQELAVTGIYSTQYIFDRAYGNYLGLYRLGQFMAHEMDLQVTQIICVSAQAKLGRISKEDGSDLMRTLA